MTHSFLSTPTLRLSLGFLKPPYVSLRVTATHANADIPAVNQTLSVMPSLLGPLILVSVRRSSDLVDHFVESILDHFTSSVHTISNQPTIHRFLHLVSLYLYLLSGSIGQFILQTLYIVLYMKHKVTHYLHDRLDFHIASLFQFFIDYIHTCSGMLPIIQPC